jgi:hypothetical protein
MIELNICRTRQGLEIDLLPWADPYIMQLFLEADMLGGSGEFESAPGPGTRSDGRNSHMSVTAPLNDDSWGINSNRRPLLPRRRRTESERLLVRC